MRVVACPPRFAPTPIRVWADFAHFAPTLIRVGFHFAHLPTQILCKVGLNAFHASRLGPALHTWRVCRPLHPLAVSFLPPLPPCLPALPRWGRFRTLTDAFTVRSRPKRHKSTEVGAHLAHLPTQIPCKVGPNGMHPWIHGCMDARLHGHRTLRPTVVIY